MFGLTCSRFVHFGFAVFRGKRATWCGATASEWLGILQKSCWLSLGEDKDILASERRSKVHTLAWARRPNLRALFG